MFQVYKSIIHHPHIVITIDSPLYPPLPSTPFPSGNHHTVSVSEDFCLLNSIFRVAQVPSLLTAVCSLYL